MPFAKIFHFPKFSVAWPRNPLSGFWLRLAAFAFGILLAVWPFINSFVAQREDEMFFALYLRAESLAWSLEGVARVVGKRGVQRNLGNLLEEMSRQPGIAWLALVTPAGKIIGDSSPAVVGQQLYTAGEMAVLKPENTLKGRFSPDDPQVFEVWRLFAPGRLMPGHRHSARDADVIFIGLNAASFAADLRSYTLQLWLMAFFAALTIVSIIALIHYISRYQHSRRNLAAAQALSDQVIASYPAPLLVINRNGSIALRNAAAKSFFAHGDNLFANSQIAWAKFLAPLSGQNKISEQELQWLLPNGETVPIILSVTRIGGSNCGSENRGAENGGSQSGECHYLVIVRELAQIRRLERQLEESRRLSDMGRLAAGVAHEIRNPLSSICGYAAYLRKRLANDPLAATTASLLEEEATRLNSALSDLLALTRKPGVRKKAENAREILKKIAALVQPDAEARQVGITVLCPADRPPVYCDRDKITQALLNLALNAVQVLQAGGRVELTGRWLEAGSSELPPGIAWPSGCWLLEVADNGPGIAPGDLEQIFTPYFTTRVEGTGLGLTLARQIAEAHEGLLTVASTYGQGAVFAIYLPGEGKNGTDAGGG